VEELSGAYLETDPAEGTSTLPVNDVFSFMELSMSLRLLHVPACYPFYSDSMTALYISLM
jgi:hypothetical protein